MISHLIIKHKPRIRVHPPAAAPAIITNPNLPVIPQAQGVIPFLGKMQYMEMLKGLRLKKGDYCVLKGAPFPFDDECIFKIEDVNELFWCDPGNNLTQKDPVPYLMVTKTGNRRRANDSMVFKYSTVKGCDW